MVTPEPPDWEKLMKDPNFTICHRHPDDPDENALWDAEIHAPDPEGNEWGA
ncbi:hypothetical protein [Rhodococcus jostii]|uniref:hypothetical protein n=1 Tax=Rhodococcus jostii TaxID=132919 RepID=UPI00362A81E8